MYNKHTTFEWNIGKEIQNVKKHGIDFETAKEVFFDPGVISVPDVRHSHREKRWYAVGQISDGTVVTVWYTPRGDCIRIIGAARLRKGRKEYEKRKFSGFQQT